MIQRMSIRCRGCEKVFTLRLGINVSKRAAFYVLCPLCFLPIQGELNGNSIKNVNLDIDGDHAPLEQEAPVTTVDLNAPVLVTADSMEGDLLGGMTNLTLAFLCQDRASEYMTVANQSIDFLEERWPDIERALRYYLNSNNQHFEAAAKKTGLILPNIGFATTHERASQLYTLLGAASLRIMAPSDEGKVFVHRLGCKHIAALHNDSYRTYVKDLLSSGQVLEREREQLEELLNFVDHAESWRMGILPRYMHPDVDLETLDWRVLRNEFPILRDLYIHGFETVCRGLGPLMASQNTVKRKDPNDFGEVSPDGRPNKKLLPPASIAKFEGLRNADKLAFVRAIPGISYLGTLLDSSLRNSIGHSSAHHNLQTGRIVTDRMPQGITYLDFMAKVADVFEALTLIIKVTRFMRVASSPDFSKD